MGIWGDEDDRIEEASERSEAMSLQEQLLELAELDELAYPAAHLARKTELFGSPGANGRNLTAVEQMLRDGMDPNADGEGGYPLHVAARGGDANAAMVDLLLQAGADPNQRDKQGRTALHWAALSCNASHEHKPSPEVIRKLAQAEADVNAVDKDDRSALSEAVASASSLRRSLGPSRVSDNDLAAIDALLVARADPNRGYKTGPDEGPLGAAVDNDDAAMVKLLLRFGANPNARAVGPNGETDLMRAAKSSRVAVAAALLDAGADMDLGNRNGATARSVAAPAVAALFAQREKEAITAALEAARGAPREEPVVARPRGARL